MNIRKGRWPNRCGSARTAALVSLAVILGVTFLAYQSVLRAAFTSWDDPAYLLNNPAVRWLDWMHLKTIFSTTIERTYVPLTILSFAAEYHFFGFDPFVYHLDNLLLHLSVAALIFLLARRMGLQLFGAAFAALLFALHPMHVESVAWVSQRKDLLYSFFYLLALRSYWRYIREYHWFSYVLSILCAFLSMLASPMALSLPLVLLASDWFYGRRFSGRVFLEKIPHVAIVVPIAWVTYSQTPMPDGPLWEALHIWLWTVTFYIQKFFMPLELIPVYELPRPISLFQPAYAQSLIVFFLTALTLIRFRWNKWVVFAALYFFLSIFFLLRSGEVADRWMYLPSLGICLALGWVFEQVFHECERKGSGMRKAFHFSMILFFLTLGARTLMQTKIWHNSITLSSYVIHKWPGSAESYLKRGVAYLDIRQWDKAMEDFNKALALDPQMKKVHQHRAFVYFQNEEYDRALADLNVEAQRSPRDAEIYSSRGNVYQRMGELDKAMADYAQALQLDPDDAQIDMNIGNIHGMRGELEQALKFYDTALQKDPGYFFAHHNKGITYDQLGQEDKAVEALTKAIKAAPRFPDSYFARGNIYLRRKEYGPALADYNDAIRLQPFSPETVYNRGIVYKHLGKFEQAHEDFTRLIQMAPGYLAAYFQRADIDHRRGDLQKAISDYSTVIRLDPGLGEAYYLRAVLWGETGQWDKALDDLRQARQAGYPVDERMIQDVQLRINTPLTDE